MAVGRWLVVCGTCPVCCDDQLKLWTAPCGVEPRPPRGHPARSTALKAHDEVPAACLYQLLDSVPAPDLGAVAVQGQLKPSTANLSK